MSDKWNRRKLYETFPDNSIALNWCINKGFIPSEKLCQVHRQPMIIETGHGKFGRFVCNKGNCKGRNKITRVDATWFENVKLELPTVFSLMYSFARNESYDETINEAAKIESAIRTSTGTVSDWFNYSRELICDDFLSQQEFRGKIGGVNCIVQVDETKIGRRKYHKGRHVEGAWLVGLIEDGSEDFRLELCPNNERTADVLHGIIDQDVMV
uniref:Transposase n=1 Tax=Meloidogyne hapla TaxID=6305 RepID=A0A1I8BKJ9_MELHA